MRYFEVKARLDKCGEDGVLKKVTETYAVDAVAFAEAEERVTKEMQPYVTGDFEVVAERIARYTMYLPDIDHSGTYYTAKINFIAVDQYTGKVVKQPYCLLIEAADFNGAKARVNGHLEGSANDWEIEYIKETKIVDVFPTIETSAGK